MTKRLKLERGLRHGLSLKKIAAGIGKNHSTAAREILARSVESGKGAYGKVANRCASRHSCGQTAEMFAKDVPLWYRVPMSRALTLWSACAVLGGQAAFSDGPPPFVFTHMADASAGEWLGGGLFVAASDEDNALRVYRFPQGGVPVASWDVSPLMALEAKSPEMDIEGSARIGDTLYWITSHAPNKEGKPRPNRRRFFATRVAVTNGAPAFQLAGQPVSTLLSDLASDRRYAAFGLAAAARRPPKTPGSLNIEALCETPEGGLLIGFRSPTPDGKALLAPLLNPADYVAGRAPRFGDPLLLDLAGDGLRALARHGGGYVILSGSPLSGGTPRLFRWRGGSSAPQPLPLAVPADATPEGLLTGELGGSPLLLALSDDGARPVDARPAKAHPDPLRRTFRAFPVACPDTP